jgi:hypothetical protein
MEPIRIFEPNEGLIEMIHAVVQDFFPIGAVPAFSKGVNLSRLGRRAFRNQ